LGAYKVIQRFTPWRRIDLSDPELRSRYEIRSVVADDEVDPDPKALTLAKRNLCQTVSSDDHSDTFTCASKLVAGEVETGILSNGSGDDSDIFELAFDRPTSLRLEISAEIEIYAQLFDQKGQRLLQEVGDGSGLSLRRSLGPGRYFLRLAGVNPEVGAYALALMAHDD
jgi:hypothetical protein